MHADTEKKPDQLPLLAPENVLSLREVERVLQLYCTALAGKEFQIKGLRDAPAELLRQSRHLTTSDGNTIYLPEKIEERTADAFDYYIVLTAHQAAYTEFGTFAFDIHDLSGEPADSLRFPANIESGLSLLSHFDFFFSCFRNISLARDIFLTVEDGRIDHCLSSQYQGLARKLERAAETSLHLRRLPESLPPLEAVVECLVRLSLGEDAGRLLPDYMQALWRKLVNLYSGVLRPDAAVTDSALVTIRMYHELDRFFDSERIPSTVFFIGGESVEHQQAVEAGAYLPAQPVDFRGQTDPGRVQVDVALDILQEFQEHNLAESFPLSPEAIEDLLKKGAKIKILGTNAEELTESSGLFVTDLKGLVQEKLKELTPDEKKKLGRLLREAKSEASRTNRIFYYDEWDFLNGSYLPYWCKLQEIPMEMGTGAEVARIRREQAALIYAMRQKYQRIRPEMLKKMKRLRDGEDIVLDHVIEAVIDRKAGLNPSYRVYQNRERRARDIATCFLLDISASTDEWVIEEPDLRQKHSPSHSQAHPFSFFAGSMPEEHEKLGPPGGAKRVIDLERETLIIVAEAIEHLGDEYAIYAFSGYGRDNVELFVIKDFPEPYSERIRRRIEAIQPRKSTRMGPAIRHSIMKLSQTGKKMKILILLSDGYPQDFDYGPDRSSKEYGLHDTTVALQEARRKNIHTFCITIDQAGNDYLHDMCGGRDYFIVRRPDALPSVLPRIYRKLTI